MRRPTFDEVYPTPPHFGGLPTSQEFLNMHNGGGPCGKTCDEEFGGGFCSRPKLHVGVCYDDEQIKKIPLF